MVRIARLAAALALPAASLAQFAALHDAGQALARGVLSNVLRLNSSQVDRVMDKAAGEKVEVNPYAKDLTDENWDTVLRTGTYNPLGLSLDEDTTWVITVYGPDQVSKMFLSASDIVARYNSSEAGGTLPANMRFARIDYATETVLPTRLWLWKPPVMVIARNDLKELRFFKVGHVAPFPGPMAELLQNRERWKSMPLWTGAMAPGGWFSPYLPGLANAAALYHKYMSKVPSFVLLLLSGFLMKIIIGFFHKETPKPKASLARSRDQQRAATKAMWANEEAVAKAQVGSDSVNVPTTVPSKGGSTATEKKEGRQRKGGE